MISADEFDLWRAYYRRRPFDDESVHHMPAALLASIYVNSHREKGKAPAKASDFLVFHREKKRDLDTKIRDVFARLKPAPA